MPVQLKESDTRVLISCPAPEAITTRLSCTQVDPSLDLTRIKDNHLVAVGILGVGATLLSWVREMHTISPNYISLPSPSLSLSLPLVILVFLQRGF